MTEPKTVAAEAAELFAQYGPFVRGNIPHREITKLYKRYVEEKLSENPQQKLIVIQREFAQLFHNKVTWVLQYAVLVRLHPDLLENLCAKINGFYLAPGVAIKLVPHDPVLQVDIWERAKNLAEGKQYKLEGIVSELCQEAKKEARRLAQLSVAAAEPVPTPAPTPAPTLAPAPQITAGLRLQEISEGVGTNNEAFLKLLAQVSQPKRDRANEIAMSPEPRKWDGGGRIVKGSNY